jgi:hypothetical protein
MPRFNLSGQVTPQIGYFWYDQVRFVYQDCSAGACVIRLNDGTLEAPRGCNELAGNGASAWAAWLGGVGLFDSFGRHFPDSGLAMDGAQIAGAMGPDGSYAIKVLRNSYGPWDVLMPDNTRWRLTDGDARDIHIISGRRAVWLEQGYVKSNFPIVGRPNVQVYAPRVADDGTLLYQDTTGRLVLGGKVIAPASASYFYPDVLILGDVYHVTWSPSQNDTNAQPLTITKAQLAALPPISGKPPTTVPPPTPEPPSMTNVPNRSAELSAFWHRWNGARPINDEAEKHRFTAAFMADLNTKDGSGRWGRKARPGTTLISKDTAGYWLGATVPTTATDGKVHAFDLISGGDGSVHWDKAAEEGNPLYANIDARWFPVSVVAPPTPGPTPTPPSSDIPTLGQWIDVEYPQLVAAYKSRHNGDDPGHTWAAFQTCRRGGVMLPPGEPAWSFQKMLAHELSQ